MNKSAVTCSAILGFAVIICVYLHSSTSRYVTANAGEGKLSSAKRNGCKTGGQEWIYIRPIFF
jgi:hypothetical protein